MDLKIIDAKLSRQKGVWGLKPYVSSGKYGFRLQKETTTKVGKACLPVRIAQKNFEKKEERVKKASVQVVFRVDVFRRRLRIWWFLLSVPSRFDDSKWT